MAATSAPTRWRVVLGLLVIGAVLAGCTSDSGGGGGRAGTTPGSAVADASAAGDVLIGEVDGGKGLIAVMHTGDAVTVYSCGFDDHLDTHTGWFNGVPRPDGSALAIPKLTNAAGLAVEGRITGDDASGTLTLATGEQVTWSAHKASGNGAGVYAAEDALAQSGLIVAEDDRMVGSAALRFSPGAVGPTTGPTPTTIKPSTSTTTRPATTTTTATPTIVATTPSKLPILAPPTRPTGGQVTVTIPIPNQPPRVTTLTPVRRPPTVNRTGPTIVFLVHGMSENATTPAADATPDPIACDGPRNSPFAGRCEFGPDFIPGLFGAAPGAQLSSLAGQDETDNHFITSAVGDKGFDETMGMALAPNGCAVDPTAQEKLDDAIAKHWIVAPTDARPTNVPIPVPPRLSVFTTWRDSTKGLVESGRRLTRQTYAATRWWEQTYHVTPQIIFVAQSFGGLATRFLVSNPTDDSLAALNPDGVTICAEDHARMDYLRNRVSYVLTLATPHEGSFLSEVGEGAKDVLRAALADLDAGLQSVQLSQVVRALDAMRTTVAPNTPSAIDLTRAVIADLLALLESPALRDMKLDNMRRWNTGPIAPDHARRTAASPMLGAGNELIPLYASMARTPGSTSFNSPLLQQGFDTYKAQRPKAQGWIIMTTLLSETIVRQFSPVGWGSIDGSLVPFTNLLDRRARIFDLSTQTTAAEQYVAHAAEDILGKPAAYFEGVFGPGVDGILAYLASIHASVFLPNAEIPIYLDRVWTIDLSGSVQVPEIALTCGDNQVVLDYEPLIRALLAAHGRTRDALDAIGDGDFGALVDAAGVAKQDGVTLAEDTVSWFQGKVAALGDAAGDDCKLPTDPGELVTDFFSLGNIAHWHVKTVNGIVPAPAWVRTEQVARDGEQDTDGAVHAASALGLQLGRDPFFFEHDRGGSWYRIPDEPITEKYNHGLQYNNDVGRWVRDRFFVPGVGPVPRADGDSAWTA